MQSGLDDFSPPTCVRKRCFCAPSLSRVESTAQQRKYVAPPPPEKLVFLCAGGPAVLRGASDGWQLASIHRSQLLQLQAGPCSVQGGARCNNIPERALRCAARTDTHHGEVSSCCLGAASRALRGSTTGMCALLQKELWCKNCTAVHGNLGKPVSKGLLGCCLLDRASLMHYQFLQLSASLLIHIVHAVLCCRQRYYISLLTRMSKRLAVKLVLLRLVDEPASRKLAIA